MRTPPPLRFCFDLPLRLIRVARCLAIGLGAFGPLAAAQASPHIENIVLVHGAFTDGAIWSAVISRLQTKGYQVTAVQNPLTSLSDDVAATTRVLRRQHGPVLLVGHSWAGAVVTQAGNAANVKGLVYLSALVPDSGESVEDLLARLKAPMTGLVPDAEGRVWLDDPAIFRKVMAADIPVATAAILAAEQQPIAVTAFKDKIGHAAWHDKPSWYLQTTMDQALPPSVQSTLAQSIRAHTTSIPSSHLSMIASPQAVADFIDKAARALSQ